MKRTRWGRGLGAVMAVALASASVLVAGASAASAATTGAHADKTCPDAPAGQHYTLGSVVPCSISFRNDGDSPAAVTVMTEQAPWPGGPTTNIPSCNAAGSGVVSVGSQLNPADPCNTTLMVTVPNDPTLCNTIFSDRAEIDLRYASGLIAGAFATGNISVVCPPQISVVKTATPLSKPTDPVDYTVTVCNTGLVPVTRDSVTDTLEGDLTAQFPATLAPKGAPGDCGEFDYSRTVLASDLPGPIVNTVTASYSAAGMTDTETDSASTTLFDPHVVASKNCVPGILTVGMNEQCTITITNQTTGGDAGHPAPALHPASITDTLTGDLLTPGNPAVGSTTCAADLAKAGDSCTIVTNRTVQAGDPSKLDNTVNALYHPVGFPNDVPATANAEVTVVHPAIKLVASATPLSKPTDDVTYTVQVCNIGDVAVSRQSVVSDLLGDETALFATTPLAAGDCTAVVTLPPRTVLSTDPNPLVVQFKASYSGVTAGDAVATPVNVSTDLFFPKVGVSKNCSPNPLTVGAVEVCVIDVTNESSGTTPPALVTDSISDTLSGDLTNPANFTSSTCGATLAEGATCEITTARTVSASDLPGPVVNTVTVHYHPDGFTNNITDSATSSVPIFVPPPPAHHECTLGFWKQSQHFKFWGGGFHPVTVGVLKATLWTDVFNQLPLNNGSTSFTLLQGLQAIGGGNNDFVRHAVAELLNSTLTSPDESTATVISEVNAAIAAGPAAMHTLADAYDAQQNADHCTGFQPNPVN